MRNPARVLALLTLMTLGPACDEVEFDANGEPSADELFGPEWRGWGFTKSFRKFNTNELNGSPINTMRFGLQTSYGETVTDIFLPNGIGFLDMSTVEVVDGELKAISNGQQLGALHFDDSWWIVDVQGQAVVLHLEDVRRAGNIGLSNYGSKSMTNLDPDRFVYKWASNAAPAMGTYDPKIGGAYDGVHTCAVDDQGGSWSILSRGLIVNESSGDLANAYWAPHQYAYFGCLTGAVGKTMLWGYSHDNPDGGLPNVSFEEYEAAIRITRADYCGDGSSQTLPGQGVTLLDQWGINEHEPSAIEDEAVFGLDGAICVDTPRLEGTQTPILCSDGTTIPKCTKFQGCFFQNGVFYCNWQSAEDVYNDDPDALVWTLNADLPN